MERLSKVDKEQNAGKKKTKCTQKRKGPSNIIPNHITAVLDPPSVSLPNSLTPQYPEFCHKNVSSCYGCGAALPDDLLVVSKTKRVLQIQKRTKKLSLID